MHGGVRISLQVDTATRERALESQLQLARRHLGTAELQAGAQAEQASHDKDAPATSIAEELAHVRPSDRSPTDAPPASSSRLTSAAACLCAGASCNRGAEERCVSLDALVQAGGLPRQNGPAAHTAHAHAWPFLSRFPKPSRRCRPTRRSRAQSWPRATLPSARAAAGTRGACGGSRPAHRAGAPRECRAPQG